MKSTGNCDSFPNRFLGPRRLWCRSDDLDRNALPRDAPRARAVRPRPRADSRPRCRARRRPRARRLARGPREASRSSPLSESVACGRPAPPRLALGSGRVEALEARAWGCRSGGAPLRLRHSRARGPTAGGRPDRPRPRRALQVDDLPPILRGIAPARNSPALRSPRRDGPHPDLARPRPAPKEARRAPRRGPEGVGPRLHPSRDTLLVGTSRSGGPPRVRHQVGREGRTRRRFPRGGRPRLAGRLLESGRGPTDPARFRGGASSHARDSFSPGARPTGAPLGGSRLPGSLHRGARRSGTRIARRRRSSRGRWSMTGGSRSPTPRSRREGARP